MNFDNIINQLVRTGTPWYDKLNKAGTATYDQLNQAGTKAYDYLRGEADNSFPGTSGGPTGTAPTGTMPTPESPEANAQSFLKERIEQVKEIADKGLIPVPTFNENVHGLLTGAKAMTGVYGMPFRLLSNPGTERYLQSNVDLATQGESYNVGDTFRYGGDIYNSKGEIVQKATPGWYTTPGLGADDKSSGRGLVGQFDMVVGEGGVVTTRDKFNTNHSVGRHLGTLGEGVLTGDLDKIGNAMIGLPVATAEQLGFLNQHPNGTEFVVGKVPLNRY